MASSLAPVARSALLESICAPTLFACQPNFQLDGYGIWLWASAPHLSHQRRAPTAGERAAVRLVARYLQAVGDSPCYDCWE